MITSETIGALAAALAKASLEFDAVSKDRVGQVGAGKYRYATLESVIGATDPALGKHGLRVIQTVSAPEGIVTVHTRLIHSSGEWMGFDSVAPDKAVKSGPLSAVQEAGKTITYLRRYALTAILGVTAEEDDDAAPTKPARGRQEESAPIERKPAKSKESAEAKAERQAKHDPSWPGAHKAVAAELKRIHSGLDIEIASVMLASDPDGPRLRLSQMTPEQRGVALAYLASPAAVDPIVEAIEMAARGAK